jgi:transcriptional regulatory protein RtcR
MYFATSAEAQWPGNFRDLNAVTTRLATLAPAGRITVDQVTLEIAHLRRLSAPARVTSGAGLVDAVLTPAMRDRLDRFDRVQLEDVLAVCRDVPSLSAGGRALFEQSRTHKRVANDADRLRKYLARFGLEWAALKDHLR